jgi:hypothetical protein
MINLLTGRAFILPPPLDLRVVSIQGWAWEYFLERPELAGLPPRPQEPENLTEGD